MKGLWATVVDTQPEKPLYRMFLAMHCGILIHQDYNGMYEVWAKMLPAGGTRRLDITANHIALFEKYV